MKQSTLLFGFVFLVGASLAQAQTLTHSYDFTDLVEGSVTNNTQITNQVTGVTDATLLIAGTGTATVDANHALTLNGSDSSNGAYLQLPANLIGTKSQITLETWTTPINANLKYSHVFDLGTDDIASRFFLAFSQDTTGNSYAAYQTASNKSISAEKKNLTSGEEYMLTTTVANNVLNYYVNGVMVARANVAGYDLSTRAGNQNWVGKSFWSGDSYANARFDIFNVYDGAIGPTEVRAKYLAGSSASTTESLNTVNAKKVDALIGSAAGFWDGTMGYFTDLSCNSRDLVNHSLVFETTNSAAIGSALSSNGITFRDGKDGSNGFANSTDANLFDFAGSATYSSRVKLDTFVTTTTSGTAMLMEAMAGQSETFGLATTHGTAENGVLTLFARGNGGDTLKYYLQNNGEAYSLVTEYNADNEYFLMDVDKWYDITGTFESTGDAGVLSLYAYDPSDGSLLAFGSTSTTYSTLSQDATEFLLMETWGNRLGTVSGVMDYAGVWQYALSAEQVAALSGQYVVPEPSTWALMILSSLGLMFFRRKK